MKKEDYVKCPLCESEDAVYHKSGIQTHFKCVHKRSWGEYLKENLGNCRICGEKLTKIGSTFCSIKCVSVYASTKVKKHGNRYTAKPIKLEDSLVKEIISFYKNNNVSIVDVINKFGIERHIVDKIFEENNVEIKKNMNVEAIRKIQHEKFLELVNSDIAKQVVREYKESPSTSFRSLDEKYYIEHHLSRKHIAEILKYHNVEIKDGNEIRKQVWKEKIERGQRHPNYYKNTVGGGNVHWYFYKGTHYQGSFEFKYALYLESKTIEFLCHEGVKPFEYEDNGKMTRYHPDFYLPNTDEYVEIKGYFSDEDKEKIELVKKTNPEMKLNVLTTDLLEEMGILSIDKTLNIDVEKFRYDLRNKEFYLERLSKRLSKEEFYDRFVNKKESIDKIATSFDVSKHLVYHLFKRYGIKKLRCERKGLKLREDYLIVCPVCKIELSTHGLANHIKMHGLDTERFKVLYFENLKQQGIAERIIEDYKNFLRLERLCVKYRMPCSYIEGVLGYFNVKLINHNKVQEEKWMRLSEDDRQGIIDLRVKNSLTIQEISKKTNFTASFLKHLFFREHVFVVPKQSVERKNRIEELLQSDLFSRIKEEYKAGVATRTLSEKYKINRVYLIESLKGVERC